MAKIVGVSQSTISREPNRNTGLNGYRHQQAKRLRDQRRNANHSGSIGRSVRILKTYL